MANYFLPSCKVNAAYPKESKCLIDYLMKKTDIKVIGCCRKECYRFAKEDTVYVICHNCAEIVRECSLANVCYIWEIIDNDPNFLFTNYSGVSMTIQNCWLSYENQEIKDVIQSIIRKLNIQIIESNIHIPYCGRNLLHKPTESNQLLAPQLWCDKLTDVIKIFDNEDQITYLINYCKLLPASKVICTCRSCAEGIITGGYEGIHLLELLF